MSTNGNMTEADAGRLVTTVFELIDHERWSDLSDHLADDIQLCDELTGVWLRGRDRVARYLQAQSGVVTQLTSVTDDVEVRRLAPGLFLATFGLGQRYLLAGVPQNESLTGACLLSDDGAGWMLRLYQLGGQSRDPMASADVAPAAREEAEAAPAPTAAPAGIGPAMRAMRASGGRTLREVAAELGVSPGHLSQIETGKSEPTLPLLHRYAEAVGMPLRALIDEVLGRPAIERFAAADRAAEAVAYEPGVSLRALPHGAASALRVSEVAIDPVAVQRDVTLSLGRDSFLFVESGEVAVLDGGEAVVARAHDLLRLGDLDSVRVRAMGRGVHRLLLVRTDG